MKTDAERKVYMLYLEEVQGNLDRRASINMDEEIVFTEEQDKAFKKIRDGVEQMLIDNLAGNALNDAAKNIREYMNNVNQSAELSKQHRHDYWNQNRKY